MRALVCEAHGDPETLVLRDIPVPEPGPGEVRIAVRAASVNFPDALVIRNLYQMKPDLPFVPGSEAAGIVEALGPGVTGVAIGDRVGCYAVTGGFAEAMVVPAARIAPLPPSMDFATGSAFTMAYGTAWHALADRGALRAGETLLVLGAAGGIGLAAVEIGRALGARVIAAASGPGKRALACRHGAAAAIDYTGDDLRREIARATDGRGPDLVFDPVGDRFAEPVFRSIALNGRYLVLGFAGGGIPSLPLNLPLLRQASIVGVAWGAFAARDPAAYRHNVEALNRLYEQGALRPHIGLTLPLERAGEGIRMLMDRQVEGKIVIEP